MADNKEAVIISAARTPTGKFQGALKGFTAPELGAIAIKEAVKRAGVDPSKIDEVIMGCVVQGSIGVDGEHGLRIWSASGRFGVASDQARRRGVCRRRRNGIDVEYPLRAAD